MGSIEGVVSSSIPSSSIQGSQLGTAPNTQANPTAGGLNPSTPLGGLQPTGPFDTPATGGISSTLSMVSNQVQIMLGNLGQSGQSQQDLVGNELLKLIISLLILDVLMGKQSDLQQIGQGAMDMLGLSGNGASVLSLQSQTTTVQIDMPTQTAMGQQAIQSGAYLQPPQIESSGIAGGAGGTGGINTTG